jgi:hemolysin activation/secretion protein
VVRFVSTQSPPDRFITVANPYGVGDFGEVGATARLVLDGRNRQLAATRGAMLWAAGTYYPKAWSLDEGFGEVHGEATAYLSPPLVLDPTLALRVGGKRVWGRYPFFESAFIGGLESVRGLRPFRYAGDAAAYANAELRLALFRFRALVPARFGIFGLADAGRVWFEDESSDKIHTGVGGGIWVEFLKPESTLSVAAATSEGRTRLYFHAGFAF